MCAEVFSADIAHNNAKAAKIWHKPDRTIHFLKELNRRTGDPRDFFFPPYIIQLTNRKKMGKWEMVKQV